MMKKMHSINESQNRQIKAKRKKIFLLALLFILKFLIFPRLEKKIMDYCLESSGNEKKHLEEESRQGFTLIEILVALAVAGIIAGISIVSFSRYQPGLNLSGFSKDAAGNLRYAQQLAVSRQTNYGVHFYPNEKKYQIVKYSDPEEVIKNIFLPSGIDFSEINFSENKLIFNIYGAAVEAGTITFENEDYNTSTIEVKPSGFIRLEN